jgi:hypothetical protein
VSANIALKHFRHFEAKIPALYDIAAAEPCLDIAPRIVACGEIVPYRVATRQERI